jgi:hypothetical protein
MYAAQEQHILNLDFRQGSRATSAFSAGARIGLQKLDCERRHPVPFRSRTD